MPAPNGLIVAWPSTAASIPSGWSRVAALDSKHAKASTSAGSSGGSATHTHGTNATHQHTDTHSHASETSGGSTNSEYGTAGAGSHPDDSPVHTHTFPTGAASFSINADAGGTSSSGTNVLSTYTVIWIQSDGTTDIASGSVMWWKESGTAPSNWAIANGTDTTPDLREKYLLGAAVGVDGGTSTAAANHTHTYSHSHSATNHASHAIGTSSTTVAGDDPVGGGGATSISSITHTHAGTGLTLATATPGSAYGTDATASSSDWHEIGHYKLLPIKKTTTAADVASGLIGCTVGSTPSGYTPCDGSNGTVNLNGNGEFIKGAINFADVGDGGAPPATLHTITHGHTVPGHTHSVSGFSATSGDTSTGTGGGIGAATDHVHALSVTGAVSGSTTVANTVANLGSMSADPPYSTVIYVQSVSGHPATKRFGGIPHHALQSKVAGVLSWIEKLIPERLEYGTRSR